MVAVAPPLMDRAKERVLMEISYEHGNGDDFWGPSSTDTPEPPQKWTRRPMALETSLSSGTKSLTNTSAPESE